MDETLVYNNGRIIIPREWLKYSKKNNLSATLLTINPTWTGLGSNPALRGERPAAKHINYS